MVLYNPNRLICPFSQILNVNTLHQSLWLLARCHIVYSVIFISHSVKLNDQIPCQ